MTIGVYTLEIHLPGARSLKAKRQVFRRLKDRLRARYNVSVIESEEHADLWQRGSLVIVSVAGGRDPLVRLFESIYHEAQGGVPGQVIEAGSEFIESSGGSRTDWMEDWA